MGDVANNIQLSNASGAIYSYLINPHNIVGGKIGEAYINDGANHSQTVAYSYDDDELLTGVGDLTLAYNTPNGQLTGTTLGSVTDSYTYNTLGEVNGYTAKYGSNTIYSYSLTRDKLGRVTQKIEILNGVTTTFNYTYDPAGRLTQVNKNGVVDSTYSYDNNSNRTGGSIHGITTAATYDKQDRMTAYNNLTFTYNANGETLTQNNHTTGVITNFTWDPFGNLKSVKVGSTTYTYGISPYYHRFQSKKGSTILKRYAYSPQGQLVGELDGSNNLLKTFVYATKSNVPDYYINSSGNKFRIISDYLGSVRLVVNVSTGAISQRMEHDEFGRTLTDTNPGLQPFGFAGGLYDQNTKYVHFGARDYDPQRGRWLSKDPILFDGGDTNLFGYVLTDPVNLVDPSGLSRLVYDGGSGQLLVYPGNDVTYGPPQSFPAGNNTIRPNGDPLTPDSFGPAPNGTFGVGPFTPKSGGPNGSYGSGIFHFDIPQRPGIGLHAGRENLGGPNYNTKGCIRTTESALDALRSDPPTVITIGH